MSASEPQRLVPITYTATQPPNMPIKLNVGGQQFNMTRHPTRKSSSLSPYFQKMDTNNLSDDSFFVDADPDIFKHIAKYPRRGVFPIFYDEAKGHDDMLYHALLAEARYFIIPKLVDLHEKKKYLFMVSHNIDLSEVKINEPKTSTGFDSVDYHHVWGYEKVAIYHFQVRMRDGMNPPPYCSSCDETFSKQSRILYYIPFLKTIAVKKRIGILGSGSWSEEIDESTKG